MIWCEWLNEINGLFIYSVVILISVLLKIRDWNDPLPQLSAIIQHSSFSCTSFTLNLSIWCNHMYSLISDQRSPCRWYCYAVFHVVESQPEQLSWWMQWESRHMCPWTSSLITTFWPVRRMKFTPVSQATHIIQVSLIIPQTWKFIVAAKEKNLRAWLKSDVQRLLSKDTIVILDAINYIKGYRYEINCIAKSAKATQCTVGISDLCPLHPISIKNWCFPSV